GRGGGEPQCRVAVAALVGALERVRPGGLGAAARALDDDDGVRRQPPGEGGEHVGDLGLGDVVGRVDEDEVVGGAGLAHDVAAGGAADDDDGVPQPERGDVAAARGDGRLGGVDERD